MNWVFKYILIDLILIAGFITIMFIIAFIRRLIKHAKRK